MSEKGARRLDKEALVERAAAQVGESIAQQKLTIKHQDRRAIPLEELNAASPALRGIIQKVASLIEETHRSLKLDEEALWKSADAGRELRDVLRGLEVPALVKLAVNRRDDVEAIAVSAFDDAHTTVHELRMKDRDSGLIREFYYASMGFPFLRIDGFYSESKSQPASRGTDGKLSQQRYTELAAILKPKLDEMDDEYLARYVNTLDMLATEGQAEMMRILDKKAIR